MIRSGLLIVTARQQSWGKVIFSQVSVILFRALVCLFSGSFQRVCQVHPLPPGRYTLCKVITPKGTHPGMYTTCADI